MGPSTFGPGMTETTWTYRFESSTLRFPGFRVSSSGILPVRAFFRRRTVRPARGRRPSNRFQGGADLVARGEDSAMQVPDSPPLSRDVRCVGNFRVARRAGYTDNFNSIWSVPPFRVEREQQSPHQHELLGRGTLRRTRLPGCYTRRPWSRPRRHLPEMSRSTWEALDSRPSKRTVSWSPTPGSHRFCGCRRTVTNVPASP